MSEEYCTSKNDFHLRKLTCFSLKEIDALKVRQKAKDFFESVTHVYIMFADVLIRAYVQKCLGENPDGNKKRFRFGRAL